MSPRRGLNDTEVAEAEELIGRLVAPMFEERAEGISFWGFYLDHQPTDAEPDEVVDRLRQGSGFYAVEMVWDQNLELLQRGSGRVIHTLEELRAVCRQSAAVRDGMDHTRKKLLVAQADAPRGTVAPRGPLWGDD